MKNVFIPAIVALSLMTTACGASGEEKQAQQEEAEAKVDEKVDDIMNQLEQSGSEATETADSMATEAAAEGDGHAH